MGPSSRSSAKSSLSGPVPRSPCLFVATGILYFPIASLLKKLGVVEIDLSGGAEEVVEEGDTPMVHFRIVDHSMYAR